MTSTLDSSVYPLPALDSAYAVSAEQTAQFQRDGHILLPQVAGAQEVQAFRPLLGDAVQRYKAAARGGVYEKSLAERDTYTKAFVQVDNLWRTDEAAKKFVLAKRFGQIAADLLGVDGVRVYLDQALFKEAGGGYTPWHQDQFYWPLDTDKTVSLWMPLVDVGIEAGTLTFADGSHRRGPLGSLAISDASEAYFKDINREQGFRLTTNEMRAGDATFHTGWTLHKAPGNSTDFLREVMTIVFFADGTKVMQPQNEKHVREIGKWLSGRQPGQLADGESNPLVFKRGK